MARLVGLALAALVSLAAAAVVVVWLAERRKREIFPSSQAQMLLNPLRRRLMPVARTLERSGLALARPCWNSARARATTQSRRPE